MVVMEGYIVVVALARSLRSFMVLMLLLALLQGNGLLAVSILNIWVHKKRQVIVEMLGQLVSWPKS